MLNGRMNLYITDSGSLSSDRYCDEINLPYYVYFEASYFNFQVDTAHPHRIFALEELLKSKNINKMDWPAHSLDLNPIEHDWDALGRCLGAKSYLSENTRQLKQMLIEEWPLLS